MNRRIYLDNAATSFPKPPEVAAAMMRFMSEVGAPGRGGYAEAREAGRIVDRCRERICRLINGAEPSNVVFTLNATDALNLAIKGVLRPLPRAANGRRVHVLTTTMEHNSVLRPLNAMVEESSGRLAWTRVPPDPATGIVDPVDIERAIRPGETALVAINHASNVIGSIQPIREIGAIVHEAGKRVVENDRPLFLVDASQSLGHVGVDVRTASIDLLAFPGHKGLLGPQGTGGLYLRPGIEARVGTLREGGTGSVSEQETHPERMPERYEAGSHNAVGIAGLSEGVAWLLSRGIDGPRGVRAHELALMSRFDECLTSFAEIGLRWLGSTPRDRRVGVYSVLSESLDPAELAAILESEFDILCRAGLHCAPLAHQMLKTGPPWGCGAVRFSLGPFVTPINVDALDGALRAVLSGHAVRPR